MAIPAFLMAPRRQLGTGSELSGGGYKRENVKEESAGLTGYSVGG